MRTRTIFLCAILLAGGCVPSLHSIVTDKTLVYDPALAGRYQVEDAVWTITGDPNEKSYEIVIEEKEGKRSILAAHLADLEGKRFLDMYPPDETQLNTGDWFNAHIIPVHCFWKLEKTETGLAIAAMNPDHLKDMLTDKPTLIKHEIIDDGRVVLTDTAENLQKFLLEGLKIEKFYGDAFELKPLK